MRTWFSVACQTLLSMINNTMCLLFMAKTLSRPTQFPGKPSFPANPVSRPNQFPGQPSFPAKPVSRPNQFPDQTSYPAKPVSLPNQYWMQELFKFLMQMSFVSYWHILKISYTHIFATILFCSKRKKKNLNVVDELVFIEVF